MVSISTYAIAVLFVTAGFFLLDIDKIALYIWAYSSLLFSLSVSLVSTIILASKMIAKDALFFNAGFGSAICIYQVLVIISILFINSFRYHIGAFIFLEIAIFVLFVVVSIVVHVSSTHIYEKNMKSLEKLNNAEVDIPKRGGL